MIELTRLNGSRLMVNSDLIQYAEAVPDTMLTLVTGEKLAVTETCATVAERALEWRVHVLQGVSVASAAARFAADATLTAQAADEALRKTPRKNE